jgi:hypothetical protein
MVFQDCDAPAFSEKKEELDRALEPTTLRAEFTLRRGTSFLRE